MEQQDWKILLVDDDQDDYILVREMLTYGQRRHLMLEWAPTYQAGQAALEQAKFDAVLVDYDMGAKSGIQLIREASARGYEAPFLLLTGRGNYEVDVDAMEAGAADYLSKAEMNASFLERSIRFAIERKRHERQLRAYAALLQESVLRIETLNAINTQIIQMPHSEELFRCVFELANTAMQSDAVLIGFRDGASWTFPLSYNLPEGATHQLMIGEESALALRVLETGETQVYDRKTVYTEGLVGPDEQPESQSALLLPLYIDGVVAGVLGFHWITKEWNATQEEIAFAEKLSASLSLAISNRRLFEGMQVEIEERKRAEAELREREAMLRISEAHYQESERRFRQTFENAAVGIAHVGLDGRFMRVNASLCNLTGYTATELLQLTFQEITHPDDLDADLQMAEMLRAGEIDSYTMEKRYRRKDGSFVWVNLTGSTQFDDSGNIEHFIAVINDISLQKRGEQALRESEQYVRQILDTLFTFVGVLTPDGVIVEANRAPLQAAGIEREDVYGLNFEDTHWWNYSPAVKQRIREAIDQAAQGHSSRFDIEARMAGDVLMPIDFMIAPMRDESGKIQYLIPSAVEITERKRIEESLRISEERFRVALSSVPIFVYHMDNQLRYTWVHNPLLDWQASELLGKTDAEIFPEDVARELTDEKQAVLNSGAGIMQREYTATIEGETYHFLVSHNPILNEEGQAVGLVGSAFNITDLRRIEAQQSEYKTHMEVQRRLSEYREKERQGIAREIHDGPIQTLVSTIFNIQSAIEFIQDTGARSEMAQVRDAVKNAVRELRETINELRPPLLIRFGLARAIRVHAEDFRSNQPGTTLELELIEDGNDLPEEVCLALYRIYQEALNNIVRHASASVVSVRLNRQHNRLSLEIRDNGQGFTGSSNLAQLIQEGHYGMAGMKERAEGIGGNFWVSSLPGQGTRIMVSVQLESSPQMELERPA